MTAAPGEPQGYVGNKVPTLRADETLPLYAALAKAQRLGLVRSASTPSKGGWGLTLARAVMASGLGLNIDLDGCSDLRTLDAASFLFSESNGRFLVTVSAEDAARFEQCFDGLACHRVGQVTGSGQLELRLQGQQLVKLDVDRMRVAFKSTLGEGLNDA